MPGLTQTQIAILASPRVPTRSLEMEPVVMSHPDDVPAGEDSMALVMLMVIATVVAIAALVSRSRR